jgi:hypothetical protein
MAFGHRIPKKHRTIGMSPLLLSLCALGFFLVFVTCRNHIGVVFRKPGVRCQKLKKSVFQTPNTQTNTLRPSFFMPDSQPIPIPDSDS